MMSKIAVVYWSGTGNTEAMANEVAEGAKSAGAEAEVFTPDTFSVDKTFQRADRSLESTGREIPDHLHRGCSG